MIFRSPFPDITIPEISFTPFILQHAERRPDKPAFIEAHTGRVITYAQLVDAIHKVAGGLASRGFRKGDVFAILSSNIPEYAVIFHAVSLLGGINTTINPISTSAEITKQLQDSGAKYLITLPALKEKALEACSHSQILEIFSFTQTENLTPLSVLFNEDTILPQVQINPHEDVVALPYSSGTTGLPKGVMLTHYNLVANLLQIDATDHIREEDVLICVLPFFHIYGLVVIMNLGIYKGATMVTMPRFDLEQFLKTVQEYRVTFAHLVPPILVELSKNSVVDRYNLSSLRTIFSAAAPLRENITLTCTQRLGCVIKQGYGMTEASPATHMCFSATERIKIGSVGVCVSNTECRIVDTVSGAQLGANQEGEIQIRGPQIMKGYLNRPSETTQAIDSDGWLHTGDIGYSDAEGHFYIVDRLKELIKYKGLQVAPAELETILLSHPAIADAAVIPIPDLEAGEIPKAFVVLREETKPEEIMAFVAERCSPYKKIRKLEIVEQIPRSASGKILRRLLKERERAKGDA